MRYDILIVIINLKGNYMATYLIDYENVNVSGLKGIENLEKTDTVYIFYSDNSNTLTFSAHKAINESSAAVNCFKVANGKKNALDFQLSTYLGYLMAKNNNDDFLIVSNDEGYSFVASFWKKSGRTVQLVQNVMGQSRVKEHAKLFEQVKQLISQYESDVPLIVEYLEKYKTKQGFNNALMKQFDNKKTSEIYKALKPLIADKKGN